MITMAEESKMDSLGYTMECPICKYDFTSEGNNVPRILPCSHSLCEMCIKTLLQNNNRNILQCPECKKKHPAPKEAQSFQQNKFLLPFIRRGIGRMELCKRHLREINIFCNDAECQKPICNLCMIDEHRDHNWVDLQQFKEARGKMTSARNESLKKHIETFKQFLQSNREQLVEKCEELSLNVQTCEAEINCKREEKIAAITQTISKCYDQMLQTVRDKSRKEMGNLDAHVASIDGYLEELECFEEYDDLEKCVSDRRKLRNIMAKLKEQAGYREYSKMKLTDTVEVPEQKIRDLCESLVVQEDGVGFNFLKFMNTHLLASTLHLNGSILSYFHARECRSEGISGIVQIPGKTEVVIWNKRIAVKYDIRTGEGRNFSHWFTKGLSGACAIDMGQTCSIVLSQCGEKKLEFRDVNNVTLTKERHSVSPSFSSRDGPSIGRLVTAAATVVLYVDESPKPNEVGWLDCSTSSPKPVKGRTPFKLQHDAIHDMCYVNVRQKELLVYACTDGVFAQNVKSSQNEWSITTTILGPLKNPHAVTSDGWGHIFVGDTSNSTVLMFSSDRVELGTVMDLRDYGRLGPICWCESEKSLVVSCKISSEWSILVVKLEDITE